MQNDKETRVEEAVVSGVFARRVVLSLQEILSSANVSQSQLAEMATVYPVLTTLWGFSQEEIAEVFRKIDADGSLPRDFHALKYIVAQVDLSGRVEKLKRPSSDDG
jgi:hypothetical protein